MLSSSPCSSGLAHIQVCGAADDTCTNTASTRCRLGPSPDRSELSDFARACGTIPACCSIGGGGMLLSLRERATDTSGSSRAPSPCMHAQLTEARVGEAAHVSRRAAVRRRVLLSRAHGGCGSRPPTCHCCYRRGFRTLPVWNMTSCRMTQMPHRCHTGIQLEHTRLRLAKLRQQTHHRLETTASCGLDAFATEPAPHDRATVSRTNSARRGPTDNTDRRRPGGSRVPDGWHAEPERCSHARTSERARQCLRTRSSSRQGLVAPTHEGARLTELALLCGMPGPARRNMVARALSLDMPEHFAPICCLSAVTLAPQVVAAGPRSSRAARVPIWARASILMLLKQRNCLNS